VPGDDEFSARDLIRYGDCRLLVYICVYVYTNCARVSSRRFVGYGFRVGNDTTLEITSTFHFSADTMTRSRALASPRGSPRGVVGEHTCRVNRHLSSSMGNSVRAKAASLTSLGAFSSFSYCCGFRAACVHAPAIIIPAK